MSERVSECVCVEWVTPRSGRQSVSAVCGGWGRTAGVSTASSSPHTPPHSSPPAALTDSQGCAPNTQHRLALGVCCCLLFIACCLFLSLGLILTSFLFLFYCCFCDVFNANFYCLFLLEIKCTLILISYFSIWLSFNTLCLFLCRFGIWKRTVRQWKFRRNSVKH